MAPQVASPPYDVVTTEEARALATSNPKSFLRVIRPEIDLAKGTNLYAPEVYAKAAVNFRLFQEKGFLVKSTTDALYLYEQKVHGYRQIGVVGVCHIDDYTNNVIKKHEYTRKDKEDDRTRHVMALDANTGPVFLTYRDTSKIDHLVEQACCESSLFEFQAEDGVTHTVWKLKEYEPLLHAFQEIPCAYVADGHHRSASAVRAGHHQKKNNPGHTGKEEYNWFLAVLFPASQLNILAYNRCVKDLHGASVDAFLSKVSTRFTMRADPSASRPTSPDRIGMFLEHTWHELHWKDTSTNDPVSALSVSILQDQLLDPILGILDPRSDPRISFVGGPDSIRSCEQKVTSGDAAVAFSLCPTSIHKLMEISDLERVMPPKSTWFEPKLRSGLLTHTLS